MKNHIGEIFPEIKKNDEARQAITNEEIYKKLLELEVRIKLIEERILKPLIG